MGSHMTNFHFPSIRSAAQRLNTRRRALLYALGVTTAMAVLPAFAQGGPWPTARPITLIAPFPAGGSTDSIGRLLANEMAKELHQSIIVDNRPGANGNIGTGLAAKAAPDGYTLLLSGIGSNAINYALYKKLSYSDASFRHISLLATGPQVIVVNNQVPASNLQDLIKLIKSKPDEYSFASAGNGSGGHLTMELIKQKAGLQMSHIPYKGFGPAMTDVIGGRVQVLALNNDGALPMVKAGKFKALAVTSKTRNPSFPTVPTVAESGIPDIEVVSWFGLSAPAGTPDAIVKQLSEAAQRAMHAPKVQQVLQDEGFVVVGNGPDEFARFVKNDIARWQAVVKKANIALD
ncbi:hypothetical protein ACEQUB_p00545 (plasmid) [Ralstonia syzygii]